MNVLAHWTQTPAAHALGWTLFHFLWEGVAIAAALAVTLLFLRAARLRYAAACLALAAMLLACAATFVRVLPEQASAPPPPAARRLVQTPAGDLPPIPAKPFRAEDVLPWAAPVWLAGVLLLHARSMAAWIGIRRLRRSAAPAPQPWPDRLATLARAVHLPAPVALLESCAVDVPVVVGYLRPAVLLPLGLLAGMPADHLEAILLHELAHIRRRDYLVNLLQTVAENLLFYHPAVWWISGVIRAERENCCDDLVVAVRGDAHRYAVALTALESRRVAGEPALAITGGDLTKRVHRLLDRPAPPHAALTPAFSAALVLLTAAVALTAWSPAPPQEQPRAVIASPYQKWLTEDVAYIITDRERAAFQALATDEEREHFIEQFWLRRDPTPGTPVNEFKEEHYRRIAYANQRFTETVGLPGWKTDRGNVYITYGPPDEIESHPSANPPSEQWLYRHIEGIGENVIIEFADQDRDGKYRMTKDPRTRQVKEAAVARSDIWSDVVQRGDMPRRAVMFGTMAENGLIALKPLDDIAKELTPGLAASTSIHGKHASGRIARAGDEPAIQLDAPPPIAETGVLRAIVMLPPLRNVIHVTRPAGAQPHSVGVLFRLAPDGRSATQIAVRYGRASDNRIEVVDGLAPGDRVIVSDMSTYVRFPRIDIQ